jgi:UTP-glucose-1-phosphate uridylyltransferase
MPAATIRQCAILAGGLGTRLGAITAATPKPALDVGGRPFLSWLMREMLRFGVEDILLLTGHLSSVVEDAVRAVAQQLPRHVSVRFSTEPAPAGTGGALFHARPLLADRFLLCNGDSLFDCNLAELLRDATRDGPETIGRMLLSRTADASRYGVVALEGDTIRRPARRGSSTPGCTCWTGRFWSMWHRPARWSGTCCRRWLRPVTYVARWPRVGSSMSASRRIWPGRVRNSPAGCAGLPCSLTATAC